MIPSLSAEVKPDKMTSELQALKLLHQGSHRPVSPDPYDFDNFVARVTELTSTPAPSSMKPPGASALQASNANSPMGEPSKSNRIAPPAAAGRLDFSGVSEEKEVDIVKDMSDKKEFHGVARHKNGAMISKTFGKRFYPAFSHVTWRSYGGCSKKCYIRFKLFYSVISIVLDSTVHIYLRFFNFFFFILRNYLL